MNKSITTFLFLCFIVLLASCSPKRNLVYFSDLNDNSAYTSQILNDIDPKIKVDDILNITVNTLSMESNSLYNQGILATSGTGGAQGGSTLSTEGYLVDKDGNINFPVLGIIHLAGLTRGEARELMTTKLLKDVKNPIVNVRIMNFTISVIGEVNRPGSFSVPNEKINVLEGLGLAGDMTPYGRRENVLVIREVGGKRTMVRLNLNDQDALNSPYFYLQQNDIVYVEPSVLKEKITNRDPFRYVSVITSIASLAITFYLAFGKK